MPWVKVDDHFDEHPKMARVGPLGWAVWLAGLAYCNRNLTDGFIPFAAARSLVSWDMLLPHPTEPDRELVYTIGIGSGAHGHDVECSEVIDMLVDAGIWEHVPGGYRVHDYGDYQPSKADVMEERARSAERQQRSRMSRGKSQGKSQRDSRTSHSGSAGGPVPVPVPVAPSGSYEPSGANGARDPMASTGELDEAFLSWLQRTHQVTVRPGNGWHLRIIDWFRQGASFDDAKDAVTAAVSAGARLDRQVIPAAEDILFPRHEQRRESAKERKQREIDDLVARAKAGQAAQA